MAPLLSDLTLPRAHTPAASDARAPEFIYRRLTASPDLANQRAPGFAHQTTERHVAILTLPRTHTPGAFDTRVPEFLYRRLTLSPDLAPQFAPDFVHQTTERQVAILIEPSNSPDTEFKGRTHPEHQS